MLVSAQDLGVEEYSLATQRIFEEYLNQRRSEGPFRTILLSDTEAEDHYVTVTLGQPQFSWLIGEQGDSWFFIKIIFDIERGEGFLSSVDRYEISKRVLETGFFQLLARPISEHLKEHSSVDVK